MKFWAVEFRVTKYAAKGKYMVRPGRHGTMAVPRRAGSKADNQIPKHPPPPPLVQASWPTIQPCDAQSKRPYRVTRPSERQVYSPKGRYQTKRGKFIHLNDLTWHVTPVFLKVRDQIPLKIRSML